MMNRNANKRIVLSIFLLFPRVSEDCDVYCPFGAAFIASERTTWHANNMLLGGNILYWTLKLWLFIITIFKSTKNHKKYSYLSNLLLATPGMLVFVNNQTKLLTMFFVYFYIFLQFPFCFLFLMVVMTVWPNYSSILTTLSYTVLCINLSAMFSVHLITSFS